MKSKNKVKNIMICPDCKRKIDLNDKEEKYNIEKIANQKIYYCYCGNEILL